MYISSSTLQINYWFMGTGMYRRVQMDAMFVTACCGFLIIDHKRADKDRAACSSSPSDAGIGKAAEVKCIHPHALTFLLQNTLLTEMEGQPTLLHVA